MLRGELVKSGMEFVSTFGPAFIINLPERADRRREFSHQLSRIGLQFDNENINLFRADRPTEAGGFPSIGAKGCFNSHLQIIRRASTEGCDQILVCEDDLDFSPDFLDRMPEVIKAANSCKWDIIYFGHHGLPVHTITSSSGILLRVDPEQEIGATHFIAFRKSVFGRIRRYLEDLTSRPAGHPDGGPMHIDGAFSRFRADNPDVATYAVMPPIGFQRPSRTDIHELKWYDRSVAIRGFTAMARRMRRWIVARRSL